MRNRRKICRLASLVLLFGFLLPMTAFAADTDFRANPQTAYAKQFIEKCDGQQWFINEIERLLNVEQKTLDTITSNADFQNIKSIGLKDRGIKGCIPSAIGELTELRYLFLSGNRLSGTIPSSLYALPYLQNIDLSDNQYGASIPANFGTMPALTHLDLHGNQYTGTIPNTILSNTAIKYFDVCNNQLSGAIPQDLNRMSGLEYLSISNNGWTAGNLPDLSALSRLKTLSAWNCRLIGSIPDSLYALTALQILDLDTNALTGEISPLIGNLQELQLLSLAHNKIGGTVPQELGELNKLMTLDISDNKLRGRLPAGVADYDKVYAQDNYMTGDVLKDLEHNTGNFTDGAVTPQYQPTATPPTVQISTNSKTNLYPLLRNEGTGKVKPILEANCYSATILNDTEGKITLTTDADGIYVIANSPVKSNEHIMIEICILANEGSERSTVRIPLATGSTGGGGGGGTAPEEPPAEEPAEIKEIHDPYIYGFPDGTFGPSGNVTREQIAAMVVRALHGTSTAPLVPPYSDVSIDRWSAGHIAAAKEKGYLVGYENGEFRSANPMTRAELAACLVRIEEQREVISAGAAKKFSDVNGTEWYAGYVEKASALHLVAGYEDGTFRPNQTVTRAEAVTMMNHMLRRDPATAAQLRRLEPPFTDMQENHWAYWNVLEAGVRHEH